MGNDKAYKRTREEWLNGIVEMVRPIFTEHNYTLPKNVRIGCGWPSNRALSKTKRVVGECWHPDTATDKASNIVISLYLDDSMEVAGTLVHELAHAATGNSGHRGEFVKCIRLIGLEGKPTEAATPTGKLLGRLNAYIKAAGKYPHSSVDGASKRKKQGTRMLKLSCGECGYVVRTTQKWVETGLPSCHCCDEEFTVDAEDEADE